MTWYLEVVWKRKRNCRYFHNGLSKQRQTFFRNQFRLERAGLNQKVRRVDQIDYTFVGCLCNPSSGFDSHCGEFIKKETASRQIRSKLNSGLIKYLPMESPPPRCNQNDIVAFFRRGQQYEKIRMQNSVGLGEKASLWVSDNKRGC